MIFQSPYAKVSVPEVPLTDFVFQHAERYGDRPALVDGLTGRSLTFRQLSTGIQRLAAALRGRGLSKGDVFAIDCPNLPEFALVFHGVARAGGIVTTLNPLYTEAEITTQLQDSGAKFLLTIPPFLDKALSAAQNARLQEVFVLGDAPGATAFGSLMEAAGGASPEVVINPTEDLVALPYSSGTTGFPKGVMLTHRNLVANLVQYDFHSDLHKLTPQDTLVAVLPFFHIFGLEVVLNQCLYKGAKLVTLPRFDMELFLNIVQDHKVTHLHLVPPIIQGMAKAQHLERFDLSSLKTVCSGAAPLAERIAKEATERLHCIVYQGYGLTETSPATHICPSNPAKLKLASVGPCLPSTEAMVVDTASAQPLGPNKNGELWIRGPQVMKGYLNNPDATTACINADGWFRTGDIGYADEDGYFYIVDRVKELIKYKGLQVAPAELEALLLTHPAVADAAVIPSVDPEAGEVPKAFLVKRASLTEQEIVSWVAERVAPHKRIRRVEFIDAIPKSLTGKLLRRLLKEREQTHQARV